MTTMTRTKERPIFTPEIETLPDPPKKRDMHQERDATVARYTLRSVIEERKIKKRRRRGTVRGEGYLRTRMTPRGKWEVLLYPDILVVFDVDPDAIDRRNGYVISEVGKPPEFVMEIASETTGRRDYTVKRDGYATLGVGEYWRFDRTGGELHDAALAGDRLVNGRYEPIPVTLNEDGVYSGYSPALDLVLCWVDGQLRFQDPDTGEYLLTYTESEEGRIDAEARAQAANDRAIAAELENSRLRERLARYESD